jgi:hypothetical protein
LSEKLPTLWGISGTLDCGSTQTDPSPVTEIEVPAASNSTSSAFYDVGRSDATAGTWMVGNAKLPTIPLSSGS